VDPYALNVLLVTGIVVYNIGCPTENGAIVNFACTLTDKSSQVFALAT
jgi:hypothetical protein